MRYPKLKVFMIGAFCLFFVCFYGVGAFASGLKINVVDVKRVMEESKAGKEAMERIKARREAMKMKWEKQKKELEALKKEIEEASIMMSKEAREKKDREFRIKAMDFERLTKDINQSSQEMEFIETKKLYEKIKNIAKKIAVKEGIDMIIEYRQIGLLYFDESLNITDKVIEELNAQSNK